MEERQNRMREKLNTMLRDGRLLSSVLFDSSEVMTVLYNEHVWFARVMDGSVYDLVDLQNDAHIKPMVDYTAGQGRRQIDILKEDKDHDEI